MIKQNIRHVLLKRSLPAPLIDLVDFAKKAEEIVELLCGVSDVYLLSLLPISAKEFPGSDRQFQLINNVLCEIARSTPARILDWRNELERSGELDESAFFRDGFHPNRVGARRLAKRLVSEIVTTSTS